MSFDLFGGDAVSNVDIGTPDFTMEHYDFFGNQIGTSTIDFNVEVNNFDSSGDFVSKVEIDGNSLIETNAFGEIVTQGTIYDDGIIYQDANGMFTGADWVLGDNIVHLNAFGEVTGVFLI